MDCYISEVWYICNVNVFVRRSAGAIYLGTTWMQELVWLVMNNCKFEEAQVNSNRRVPFFELAVFLKHFKNQTFNLLYLFQVSLHAT
jgi:Sulfotransferase domain